ncbi:MAG: 3-hydroxyacyl-CoA dehydrogenase family protein [Pseudomonadota bacterium]
MQIEKLGIMGFGEIGRGIAQMASKAGCHVAVWDKDEASLEEGKGSLNDSMDKAVESGTLNKEEKEGILTRITLGLDMAIFKESDLVIESVPEDLALKKKVVSGASKVIKAETILATSTSCFSVTGISQSALNPQRFLGMHFFRPPQDVRLVEVVRAEGTSQETMDLILEFCAKIGKETVVVKDSPGFIVNYLLVPYMNQALNYYEHGLADKEGLDTAIRMGLGYPKGPLTLVDQMGLDDYLQLTSSLYERLGDQRFFPPPILKRMVDGGKPGKKSGEGFYTYNKKT